MLFQIVLLAIGGVAAADEPIDMGDRRELFVDHHLIGEMKGTRLVLHAPRHASVALRFDRPWEGAFCGYVTVIKDGELYRMYYRGLPEAGKDGSAREVTCYAESRDGVTWTKPDLGLFEIDGTRENNVVLADAAPANHNFSPFLDTSLRASAEERYKALGGTSESGLVAFVSPDGIRWRTLRDEPVFRDSGWVFDSQNVAFWSESENCYLLYYRKSPAGVRAIARATSSDFIHWSEGEMMTFGDTPAEHLYTNQTQPYYRAPHIYVSVAARFMPGRQVLSSEQAKAVGVDSAYFGDCSDVVLLTTRGGHRYERTFMESFVRPGPGLENWVSRTNYAALGIVATGDGEMSLYVQKNYGQPTARLDRYTLRPDGFVSVNAPYAGRELITRPVRFSVNSKAERTSANPRTLSSSTEGARGSARRRTELVLNFATSAAGFIKVEIQDVQGTPIPGFSLDDAGELIGDEFDRPVTWKGNSDVSRLADQPLRLRFVMKDADLYAVRFGEAG